MIRIYFAGPLFTTYERRFIEECAGKLRKEGFEVCVPHEAVAVENAEKQKKLSELSLRDGAIRIFDKCYEEISWANVLIAMVDGTQVDDGTASEIGTFNEQMLSGKGEKLGMFGLTSDMRVGPKSTSGERKGLNFYTVGAIYKVGGDIYDNIEDIIEELRKLERAK
jgi:hypothetical protein